MLCIIITAVCICVLIHNFPPFVLVQKDHLTICMLSPYYEKSPTFPAVLKKDPAKSAYRAVRLALLAKIITVIFPEKPEIAAVYVKLLESEIKVFTERH